MRNIPAIIKGAAIFILIAAVGVAIGLLSSKKPEKPAMSEDPAPTVAVGEPGPDTRSEPRTSPRAIPVPVVPTPQPVPQTQEVAQAAVPAPPNLLTNWEARLEEILDSDLEEKDKAAQMASSLPLMPEEGQMEVAQHLSNLVVDEDYGLIAGFLTNTGLPESVLDVFLADSLNRPNAVKLPLLLEVAQNQQHPKAAEAREILELYLEEDYGNDWTQWNTKLQEWIKNNPD